ncbi:MAG: hypothetical protein ACE5DL_04355 [Nitrosopumilaceae archaeon]
MSAQIPIISTSDGILRIKKLIENKQGDQGRLEYISETLQKGKPLFHSDQIYLTKKIFANVEPAPIQKPTENEIKLKKVKRLISLKLGEPGRLQHILQSLQKNRKLYHSDEEYIELKTEEFRRLTDGKKFRRKRDVIPTVPKIEREFETFYEPTPSVVKEKSPPKPPSIPDSLQEIEDAVLAPKPKEPSNLIDLLEDSSRVNLAIDKERQKINKLKHDHEQLKVLRDELSQLIAYRQEYEIKINREKESLEREIKIEQEKVKEKDRLVEELIKNQSKIIQTKTEREVLLKQIKIEKEKSEEDLNLEQVELDKVKKRYKELQNDIKIKEENLVKTIKESQKIKGDDVISGDSLDELISKSDELKEVVREAELNKDKIDAMLIESKKMIEEQNRIIEAEKKLRKLKSDFDES